MSPKAMGGREGGREGGRRSELATQTEGGTGPSLLCSVCSAAAEQEQGREGWRGGGRSVSNHKGVKAAERHPKILHITSQRREGRRDEGNRGGTEGGKAGGAASCRRSRPPLF